MMSRFSGVLGALAALLAASVAVPSAFANDVEPMAGSPIESGSTADPSADSGAGPDAPVAMDAPVATDATAAMSDAAAMAAEPVSEPAVEPPAAAEPWPTDSAPVSESPAPAVVLGEIGYDAQGRQGRIHIVVPGDTLWDISDAYLGTPWVWPSIWTDNRDIQNPHLILPNDRIWISRYEMRRVTAEEAERLLAGTPQNDLPAAFEDAGDLGQTGEDIGPHVRRVSAAEASGLVTSDELESFASVVDSVAPRVMMVQPDEVYLGLGESEVSVGDQFTIFRTDAKVYDPDTNRLLGYHANVLGWAEITQPDREASVAIIQQSNSEIEAGDRVMPRPEPVLDIEELGSPHGIEGKISFLPQNRGMMASEDFVYLNRGESDGLNVGHQLAVYRPGWKAKEVARHERVQIPDRPIAQLLVVSVRPQTSVALVVQTETELELGDRFRGAEEFASAAPASLPPE